MHPSGRRCSALAYARYARFSRLAGRAPRRPYWSRYFLPGPDAVMFVPLPDDVADATEVARPRLGDYADVLYIEEVESTNDIALALAGAGRREGTSVLADVQRSGRGRRGSGWFSPPAAGLYLSVLVRPVMVEGAVPLVTLAAGVAAAEAVEAASRLPSS